MKDQHTKVFKSTRYLTTAAMLTALSIIIGAFCKNYLNFGQGLFRITFECLPIMAAGILLGPLAGGLVGGAADLLSYLMSSQQYPPNLIVTVGAVVVGVMAGLGARVLFCRLGTTKKIIFSCSLAHIVGSMIIKPIGLYQFYGVLVLWRIPLYLLIAPIEIFILCKLLSSSAVKRLFDRL